MSDSLEYKDGKIYGSDVVPNERYFHLHSRSHLNMTGWDMLKKLVGKMLRLSVCFRVIVVLDEDGRFLELEYDTVGTKVDVLEQGDDGEMVDAKFSKDNYDKLHNTKQGGIPRTM